jgi:hypothetical protein
MNSAPIATCQRPSSIVLADFAIESELQMLSLMLTYMYSIFQIRIRPFYFDRSERFKHQHVYLRNADSLQTDTK